jgi:hypothetical protein
MQQELGCNDMRQRLEAHDGEEGSTISNDGNEQVTN